MNNVVYPDWQTFAYKYRGCEEDAFEDLARTLFRKEMGIRYGLFQRVNHKGNETDVVEKDGKVIGFQSKYFKNGIKANDIIDSMKGAKESHPEQTHYYIYCNLAFGNPRRRKGQKKTEPVPDITQTEEAIESVAKELGLTIVWKQDKAILDEVISEKWIYDVFFNVEGKLESLLTEEIKHTEAAFASIGYTCQYHNQNIHVNRTRTIERLEKLPSSSLLVIHGEGGCGKTAILHEFLERHKEEYPVYYRKASVLNVQTLAQVFHQGNLYAMDDFLDAYKDSQRKYFVIDSAEHLEAMPDETILPTLIRMLIGEGWCVVFTVRNVFLSDLLNFLSLNLKLKNVPTESVELLTEQELMAIGRKYSIKLPADVNLRDRLRNLFYLNLYTQYYDEIDGQSDERSFLQFVWEKKIRGKDKRTGYIRENEFEAFVEEKVKSGQVFLSPNKYVSKEFYSLIEDEVIALDPVNGLFITHDIFEEWGLYRFIEQSWQKKVSIVGFFTGIGDTRAVRRSFRLWLKDKVKDDVEAIKSLAQVGSLEKMPELWKDDVLCALLSSDKAHLLLADVEDKILSNTDGYGDKVIWLLRVGCQYVREVVRLKDFYWPICVPIGSGWGYIIDLIYQNREKVNLTPWLPVLLDWTKPNYRTETTRKAGLMILEYYRSSMFDDYRYRDGVKGQVCEIINNAAWLIKDELKALLEQCMAEEELSDDLPYFILRENTSSLNIFMALPDVVAELCLFYWKEKEDKEKRYYHPFHSGDAFGIDEDRAASRYFPPGAGQTPTFTLLLANEKIAVDFIIRLMNECVDHYAHSKRNKYCVKVEIKNEEGVENWQWHSTALWGMYRGMDTSPYTLQSVHMALEQYLLNLSKEEKYEQCEHVMKRLLYECHSSSVSAVVASLVLAYPSKYWKEALVLLRTVEFIEIDNQRALNEKSMESFYGIGYTLNPTVTKERWETCKQDFRKSTLEKICLDYQFFGNQKELDVEQGEALIQTIYGILDEHRKLLSKAPNQELLEILLSRMDRRRLMIMEEKKVEGGFQIQFDAELGEEARKISEEAAVDQQEMYKYIGLLNWAMAKMKGEKQPHQTYGDDFVKALSEAQTLEKELQNGRKPFITDAFVASWVAPCLLKFYSEQLTVDALKWCKNVVDIKLNGFKSLTDAMDGTDACIHVIPQLIKYFPEDKQRYFELLLRCLMAPDYGNLSSRECVITAVRVFDLWTNEPDSMRNMIKEFVSSIKAEAWHDEILALNVVVGLTPNEPDEWIMPYTIRFLKRIPQIMEGDDDSARAMFAVIENLARLFVRVNSNEILDAIEYTKPIVKESYLGDAYLNHIIFEADGQNKPDRFWQIWNSYKDMLPILMRMGYNQLRTYLLNIKWNDGLHEWRCLRQKDLGFFTFVAENSAGNAVVLESITRALTNIAHSYQKEGMAWISKVVENHPTINISGTNTLFYLEQVMMEYVYGNKMLIRKTPTLHEQVRTILNFMVRKSSVTGYVLRDMVN